MDSLRIVLLLLFFLSVLEHPPHRSQNILRAQNRPIHSQLKQKILTNTNAFHYVIPERKNIISNGMLVVRSIFTRAFVNVAALGNRFQTVAFISSMLSRYFLFSCVGSCSTSTCQRAFPSAPFIPFTMNYFKGINCYSNSRQVKK